MYEDRRPMMDNAIGCTSACWATGVGRGKPGVIVGACGRTTGGNPPKAEETASPRISWMVTMF